MTKQFMKEAFVKTFAAGIEGSKNKVSTTDLDLNHGNKAPRSNAYVSMPRINIKSRSIARMSAGGINPALHGMAGGSKGSINAAIGSKAWQSSTSRR